MKFLDSSIWLAHLLEANEKISDVFEYEGLIFSSILTIFEVKKKLVHEKFDSVKVHNSIELIKKVSIVVNLNEEIIDKAVKFSVQNKLSSIDSLIYASAMNVSARLITADNDFRKLENVEVINK